MRNQAMLRKLHTGEAFAVDLASLAAPFTEADERDPDVAGTYKLSHFVDDVDYFVKATEEWIWSIGRRGDGAIFASTDTRFYQHPRFECLWLR